MTFQPHRYCLLNNDAIITTMNVANFVIALSYYLIPLSFLIIYIAKNGKLGAVTRRFVAGYAVFILGCGTTHIMDIVVIYFPNYYAQTAVLILTALVSFPVAIFTISKIPVILEK